MSSGPVEKGVLLVDGGYFENVSDVAEEEHGAQLELERLSSKLAKEFHLRLVRTKFYHAYPYQDSDPTEAQKDFYSKRKRFYDAINRKDGHEFVDRGEVKRGQERCHECGNTWNTYSQKGVDVGIAVDLVDMAYRSGLDALILLAGDGDLVHAIEAAKNAYVNVYLAYCDASGHQISYAENIVIEADRAIELTIEYLEDCV